MLKSTKPAIIKQPVSPYAPDVYQKLNIDYTVLPSVLLATNKTTKPYKPVIDDDTRKLLIPQYGTERASQHVPERENKIQDERHPPTVFLAPPNLAITTDYQDSTNSFPLAGDRKQLLATGALATEERNSKTNPVYDFGARLLIDERAGNWKTGSIIFLVGLSAVVVIVFATLGKVIFF